MPAVRKEKRIIRKMLQEAPDTLFVFGDNMVGYGLGGQAKEMRGEPNAVGIPTKLLPDMNECSFFRDQDFDRAKVKIDAAFMRLFVYAANGGDIVWPDAGIGTGLAELAKRAPRIWEYIEEAQYALETLVNSK